MVYTRPRAGLHRFLISFFLFSLFLFFYLFSFIFYLLSFSFSFLFGSFSFIFLFRFSLFVFLFSVFCSFSLSFFLFPLTFPVWKRMEVRTSNSWKYYKPFRKNTKKHFCKIADVVCNSMCCSFDAKLSFYTIVQKNIFVKFPFLARGFPPPYQPVLKNFFEKDSTF